MEEQNFHKRKKTTLGWILHGKNTKGDAAKYLKKKLKIDTCVYLGNDLNDLSMFSNAIDDDDFVVIAKHEREENTKMIIQYLKEECKLKNKNWDEFKILVLDELNVNKFLHKISKVLRVISSKKKINKKEDEYLKK